MERNICTRFKQVCKKIYVFMKRVRDLLCIFVKNHGKFCQKVRINIV